MIPPFLHPTPISLKSLAPWAEFLTRLDKEVDDKPGRLRATLIDTIAQDVPDLEVSTRKRLTGADDDDAEFKYEALHHILTMQVVRAYVANPSERIAFLIKPHFWGPIPVEAFDVEETIEVGRLTFDSSAMPEDSLEQRMANLPLFVSKEDINRLFEKRPSSAAAARAAAQEIIAAVGSETPAAGMRKTDFIATLRSRVEISKRQAEKLWANHTPDSWKRPGTKSGGR